MASTEAMEGAEITDHDFDRLANTEAVARARSLLPALTARFHLPYPRVGAEPATGDVWLRWRRTGLGIKVSPQYYEVAWRRSHSIERFLLAATLLDHLAMTLRDPDAKEMS